MEVGGGGKRMDGEAEVGGGGKRMDGEAEVGGGKWTAKEVQVRRGNHRYGREKRGMGEKRKCGEMGKVRGK